MTTAAGMFYGGNVPLQPSPSILEKDAAPVWVRMLRAGKLSPQALAKITASMPEGNVRFVKNLGSGAFNVADLMAGKLKDHAGLMVRKLPQNPAVDMRLQAADALRSSRILAREHGDLVAPYLRGSGERGLFQMFGDKRVVPNWELAHKKLQAGERLGINDIHLDEKLYAPADTDSGLLARSAARVYAPLIQRGVKDIRAANLGPGGQLIDWQMEMRGWPHRRTLKGKTRLFGGAKDYITHAEARPGNVKALPQMLAKTQDEAHNLMQRYRWAPPNKKHDPIRQYWLSPPEEPMLPAISPPETSKTTNLWQRLNPRNWFKQAELAPDVQLQDHQQRIADRISGDDPRLLVYHGLGSGKSLSALAAAEKARTEQGGEYGVVVPASLKGNFEKEIAKFTRDSNPEVMSYTGLGMGKDFTNNPDTLIMDEAARLRNPTAASTAAAIRAAQKAKRLVLLTGTPITNEPSDIASLLSMLHNKPITPQQFDQQFVSEKKVRPGILAWLRGVKPGMKPVIKNESKLRALLEGKVDYLPSKTPEGVNVNEEVVRVPLSAEQQRIQKAIRTKIPPGFLWKLDQEFPLSRDELAKLNSFLTGLRQVSLSTQPFRADRNKYRAYEQSSKLQKAMADLQATLKSDPRKKAIIYSNFIDAGLGPYAAALEKNKIPHAFFHGGIPVKARQQALKAYNEGKLKALLLGPAAAEGISTKGTSLIQLLDPHWNEARSQQARGRGLRFDSHEGLPEELRNVAVRRYLSASEDPGIVGKYLLGRKRERTGDEVLERLTAEKEQFNDVFRNLLREVGSEKQGVSRWRTSAALLAFAKKKLQPHLMPDNYKNLTRGEALENAIQQLGGAAAEQSSTAPLSKFFRGFNKKLLAEGKPSEIPSVTTEEPTVLFRKLRSAYVHPKPNAAVPYVHGSPHSGALSNSHYGNSMFSGLFNGRTPLFAQYKPTPGQTYGPDYHLDSGFPGMRWTDIPVALRPRQGATYETPITASNQFIGYGVGMPGGSEKYHALPNTSAWQNVFGGKHGLMRELMPAPNSQTVRAPETIELGRQSAQTALRAMQKASADETPSVAKKKKPAPEFTPDFTPEQLEAMGVYDSLYRGIGPRLASLGEWKPEWVNPVDPKGWAQWYKRYSGGRRLGDEDERQIKRWANFKSRHGGPFVKNPTPRRGWALQNWGIDPSLLVPEDQSDKIKTMLRDYAAKQTAKHVANTTPE